MHINDMTRKDFEKLPHRKWDERIYFTSMVIIPSRIKGFQVMMYKIRKFLSSKSKLFNKPEIYEIDGMHDSGYRIMDFAAVDNKNVAFCLLSGCSDVIHFDGIGGFGKWENNIPSLIPPSGWTMDCLPKSGLLRIFSNDKIYCGMALSSFEIYNEK